MNSSVCTSSVCSSGLLGGMRNERCLMDRSGVICSLELVSDSKFLSD